MSISFSWVELHGALTHFPIAFLLASVACDVGTLVLRWPASTRASQALLAATVVSSIPALITGYFTGRGFGGHPPVGFELHWIAAVATSVIALLLLLWRGIARDKLGLFARVGAVGMAFVGAAAVSLTGYLGGQMVFGGAAPAPAPVPTVAVAPQPASPELALAAGHLNLAAERLGLATDKLEFVTQIKREQATAKRAAAPTIVNVPSPPENDGQLNTINASLSQITAQLGTIADRLPALAASPPKNAFPQVKPITAQPVKTTPKLPPGYTAIVSKGEKLFHSDDMSCISCHKIAGTGGAIGPDLTHEGSAGRSAAWQTAHLKDPASQVPGSHMPPYNTLKPADAQAIVAYLGSLK